MKHEDDIQSVAPGSLKIYNIPFCWLFFLFHQEDNDPQIDFTLSIFKTETFFNNTPMWKVFCDVQWILIFQVQLSFNDHLYRWKILPYNLSFTCNQLKEAIIHFFTECPMVENIWKDVNLRTIVLIYASINCFWFTLKTWWQTWSILILNIGLLNLCVLITFYPFSKLPLWSHDLPEISFPFRILNSYIQHVKYHHGFLK